MRQSLLVLVAACSAVIGLILVPTVAGATTRLPINSPATRTALVVTKVAQTAAVGTFKLQMTSPSRDNNVLCADRGCVARSFGSINAGTHVELSFTAANGKTCASSNPKGAKWTTSTNSSVLVGFNLNCDGSQSLDFTAVTYRLTFADLGPAHLATLSLADARVFAQRLMGDANHDKGACVGAAIIATLGEGLAAGGVLDAEITAAEEDATSAESEPKFKQALEALEGLFDFGGDTNYEKYLDTTSSEETDSCDAAVRDAAASAEVEKQALTAGSKGLATLQIGDLYTGTGHDNRNESWTVWVQNVAGLGDGFAWEPLMRLADSNCASVLNVDCIEVTTPLVPERAYDLSALGTVAWSAELTSGMSIDPQSTSFESPAVSGSTKNVSSGSSKNSLDHDWVVSGGDIDLAHKNWVAVDGTQSVDLNGCSPGAISQTFQSMAGENLNIAFSYAGNPDGGPTLKTFEVILNNQKDIGLFSFDTTSSSRTNMQWRGGSVAFQATGTTTTVTFQSSTSGCYGPTLDDVTFTAAPSSSLATTNELESASTDGAEGNSYSSGGSISSDGNVVAFDSAASNLAPDSNGHVYDVFVRDRTTSRTTLVSTSSAGVQGNKASYDGEISPDGTEVLFLSSATNLVPAASSPTNNSLLYLKDLVTGTTTLVSSPMGLVLGAARFINAGDGLSAVFVSEATDLAPGFADGRNHLYKRNLTTSVVTEIPTTYDGTGNVNGFAINFTATTMVYGDVTPDDYSSNTLFVRDMASGVSRTLLAASDETNVTSISADGSMAGFESYAADVVPGDTNGTWDGFVINIQSGAITRVTTAADGTEANASSGGPSFLGGNAYVIFSSEASNLAPADTNGQEDLFRKDLGTGEVDLLSVPKSGTQNDGFTGGTSASTDGKVIVGASESTHLISSDTNGSEDVFVITIN